MGKDDKLIKIASYNTELNYWSGVEYTSFPIYRSKGLLTHLINRKHFVAAKYIDCLPEVINNPNFVGIHDGMLIPLERNSLNASAVRLSAPNGKFLIKLDFACSCHSVQGGTPCV